MNIIEAVKAMQDGKKVKRKVLDGWYGDSGESNQAYLFTLRDLVANDWEVYQEKRELSWEEIEKAVVRNIEIIKHYEAAAVNFNSNKMKKELGFK